MKSTIRLVTALVFCCCFAAPASANLSELAARLKTSLVSIEALRDGVPFATGSGFIVSENGLVATNYHVIEGGNGLRLKLSNGEIYDRVSVLDADARRDLAVLKIPAVGLPSLPFAPVDSATVGDDIYVMGNPMGLEATFSTGIVSANRLWDGVQILQITAPISSGSSGGPVVNREGQIVAVSTAVYTEGQNLNFAVPGKHVQGLMASGLSPVPFTAFAAANWDSAGAAGTTAGLNNADQNMVEDPISPWVRSAAQERGYDLSDILPTLMEVNYPEQEVLFQMRVTVEQLAAEGYEWLDIVNVGTLDSNGVLGTAQEMPPGDYIAFGFCDADCNDIDLYVLDSADRVVVSDEEDDPFPVVEFSVNNRELMGFFIEEHACNATPCVHLVTVLKAPMRGPNTKSRKVYGPAHRPGS